MSALGTPDGVLVIDGIRKEFGQTRALDGVSLTLRPGEVVALLGENGAGKSTLANILDGVTPPDDGTMTIDGQPYRPRSPQDALRAGIGVVHQEISIVPTLSVAENLFLGMRMPAWRGLISRRRLVAAAGDILDDFGLGSHIDPARPAGSLSIPTQQLVAIIKVLHRQVRVLILDEPTAAFADEESQLLFERMREFRQRGVALIYITHRLHEIPLLASRAVVLRDGRLISEHDPVATPVDVLVRDMVGRSIDKVFPSKAPRPEGDPVLEVRGLTSRGHFQDVSFAVRPGEILGIAGLIGTGRSAILRTLAGDVRATSGSILVGGREARFPSPREAIAQGIVLAPEDRKTQGLLLEQSIQDNLALPELRSFVSHGLLSFRRIHDNARRIMERMTVRGGRPGTRVGRLSGGNQQKVLLGRCVAVGPRVLLLDEPTRGVDVGARMAIYEHLVGLARDGVAIVVVSSELEEVIGLCHRIGLMRKDRRFGGVVDADTDREAIMRVIVAAGSGDAASAAGNEERPDDDG